MSKLLCYNRGCGADFDPNDNESKSCTYHPGTPVFHEGMKGWSCCPKKTTDFTEFLNIKGCTKGNHSNVKPIEPEKPKVTNENVPDNVIEQRPINKPQVFMERPSGNVPLDRLKYSTAPSLEKELEKLKNEANNSQDTIESTEIPVGTSCKNGGCRKEFGNEIDNNETCMHHPGSPVFHEGMKYWTCCLRKTSDFNSFLEQEGCTVGKHTWVKTKSKEELQQSCRYDWFQTGVDVVLNIYAKLPIPLESLIEANSVKLNVHIVFGADKNAFDLALNLYGIVDISKSSILFTSNKVEVKLKKAEAMSWSYFALPEKKENENKEIEKDDLDIDSLTLH